MRTHTFINLKTTIRHQTDDPFFYFKEAQKGGGYIFESHSGNITPYLEIAQNNDKLEVASSQFIRYNTGGAKSVLHRLEKYSTALEEINNGQKGANSHWMWYIFPQLKIGDSEISNFFALDDLAEAEAYLEDSTLRKNYLRITEALHTQINNGETLEGILEMPPGNDIDVKKVISSLTLMRAAATSTIQKLVNENNRFISHITDLEKIIENADVILHGREPCQITLKQIKLEQDVQRRFKDLQPRGEGASPARAAARGRTAAPASPAAGASPAAARGRYASRTGAATGEGPPAAPARAAGAAPAGAAAARRWGAAGAGMRDAAPAGGAAGAGRRDAPAAAAARGRYASRTGAATGAKSPTQVPVGFVKGRVEPLKELTIKEGTPAPTPDADKHRRRVASRDEADARELARALHTRRKKVESTPASSGTNSEPVSRTPSLEHGAVKRPPAIEHWVPDNTPTVEEIEDAQTKGVKRSPTAAGGSSDPSRASTPQAPLRNRFKDASASEERAAGATGDAARDVGRSPSQVSLKRHSPDQLDPAQPYATEEEASLNGSRLSPSSPPGTPNNRSPSIVRGARAALAAGGTARGIWRSPSPESLQRRSPDQPDSTQLYATRTAGDAARTVNFDDASSPEEAGARAAGAAGGGQPSTPAPTPLAGRGSTDDRDPLSPISPTGTQDPYNRSPFTGRTATEKRAAGDAARRVSFKPQEEESDLNDTDKIISYYQEQIEEYKKYINKLAEEYTEGIKRLQEQYKTQQASTDSEGNIEDLKRQIEEVQKLHENTLSQKEVEFVTKISEQEDTIRTLTTKLEVAQTKEAKEKAALQEEITELRKKAAQPYQADPSDSPPPPCNESEVDKNISEIANAIGGIKYDQASNRFVPDTNATPTGFLTYKTKYDSAIFKLQHECNSSQYQALSERLIEYAINISQCTPSNIDKEELEFFSKLLDPERKTKINNKVEISFKNNFKRIKNADLLATYLATWNREDFNEYITKYSNQPAYRKWKDNKDKLEDFIQDNSDLKAEQANNNDKREELGARKANNNIGMSFSSFIGLASLITGIALAVIFQNPYLLLITSGTIISTIGYFACSSNYDKYQKEDKKLNQENRKIADKIRKNSEEIKLLNNQLNDKQTSRPTKNTGIGLG